MEPQNLFPKGGYCTANVASVLQMVKMSFRVIQIMSQ